MTKPQELSYILHKARAVTANLVRNLCHIEHDGYAARRHRGPRSGTAIVVGAGPSLSTTGPQLAAWQQQGALILTVNAALPAVSQYVKPDVVVAREAVNVASHMAHPFGCAVLDLGVEPAVWESAKTSAGEVRWFLAGALQNFELASTLDVHPLFGGTAALTAAVALAEAWGAARVVLVGVDLAFAPDGTGYASGSAWGGYRGEVQGDAVQLAGAGYDAMQSQAGAVGIPGPPSRQSVTHAPAWGGSGTVSQLLTWADQREWLERFAARHPEIECIDATGAGCRKAGWLESTTPTVDPLPLPSAAPLAPGTRARAVDDIRQQCSRVETLAATALHPDGAIVAVPEYLAGSDVVDAAAAAALIQAASQSAPPHVKTQHIGAAFRDAASFILALTQSD